MKIVSDDRVYSDQQICGSDSLVTSDCSSSR